MKKLYVDLDLKFQKRPVTGDVSLSYDEQAVIRSVRNLLSTKHYERPFQPTLGAGIDALLFELITPLTGSLLTDEIKRVISNWEPRARIYSLNVAVLPEQNAYSVSIIFYIGNNVTPTGINIILARSR